MHSDEHLKVTLFHLNNSLGWFLLLLHLVKIAPLQALDLVPLALADGFP